MKIWGLLIIFHGPGTQERLSRSDIAWNSSSAFFVGTGVGGAPATTSDLPATVAGYTSDTEFNIECRDMLYL